MQSQERKQMIQQGFDTVAPGYDHPSLAFFPETAQRLVNLLNLEPQQHLLDVCTGTGYVALEAAQQLPQGLVVGIDLSSGMLQQARNKAVQQNLGNALFHQMDLEHLSLDNLSRTEAFDIATISFGLFFFEDMSAALNTIVQTVKPNGKIAVTSFAGEAFSPMADIFMKHYKATGREMPDPSWRRLATEALLKEQFNAVGITKVKIDHQPLGYQMTDSQNWWDVVWNAGWRNFLNQMSEQEQQAFKQTHLKEIDQVIGEEGTWFNTEVLIAVGEK